MAHDHSIESSKSKVFSNSLESKIWSADWNLFGRKVTWTIILSYVIYNLRAILLKSEKFWIPKTLGPKNFK